ncbi:MAG: hypothetical protein LBI44_07210 [Oscillospiraceae bacterium]|jgi:hypothetical protein|nr:hypothetical protein [Oscillospiraceae bacterium]
MRTKPLALLLAALFMLTALAACGGSTSPSDSAPPSGSPSPSGGGDGLQWYPPEDNPNNDPPPAGALVFAAGSNLDYLMMNLAGGDPSELSVSNNALLVKLTENGVPQLGIDISSMFGEDVSKIRSIETRIRTQHPDGKFYAASGRLYTYTGENNRRTEFLWGVALEKNNPRTLKAELPAELAFVSGAKNILVLTKDSDLALAAGAPAANLIIDYILFKDAAGNAMTPDTSVTFDPPAGFGPDRTLLYALTDVLKLDFMHGSATGSSQSWGQAASTEKRADAELFEQLLAKLVPGAIIEAEFEADRCPELIAHAYKTENDDGSTLEGEIWGKVPAYMTNLSGTTVQFRYEDIFTAVSAYNNDDAYLKERLSAIHIGDTGTAMTVKKVSIGMRVEDGRQWKTVEINQYQNKFRNLLPLNDSANYNLTSAGNWKQLYKVETLNQAPEDAAPAAYFDPAWIKPGCYITAVYTSAKKTQYIFQRYETDSDKEIWCNVVGDEQNGFLFDGDTAQPELGVDQISYEKILAIWELKGGDKGTFAEQFNAFWIQDDGAEYKLLGLVIYVP